MKAKLIKITFDPIYLVAPRKQLLTIKLSPPRKKK